MFEQLNGKNGIAFVSAGAPYENAGWALPGTMAAARKAFMASEQPGFWIDPFLNALVFQDEDKNTPVSAEGQPVAAIDDRAQSRLVSQPNSERRMDFQTDGTRRWLEAEGGDALNVTGPFLARPYSLVMAVRVTGGSTRKTLMQGYLDAGGGSPWHVAGPEINGDGKLSAGISVGSPDDEDLNDFPLDADVLVSITYDRGNTDQLIMRIGGVEVVNATVAGGSDSADGISIFTNRSDLNSVEGRLYACAFVQDVVAASVLVEVEQAFAQRMALPSGA